MSRKSRLAMVHIACKDLGLDDGAYRSLLERITGASSAKGLDDRALGRVIDEFKRLGWKPKAGSLGKRSADPQVRMVWALWSQLVSAKAVRARSPRAALRAFVARQTGVADPEWLDSAQARSLIEQLKKWLDRVEAEARRAKGTST